LANQYGGSPSAAVMSVYSEHAWLPWRFEKLPVGFFDEPLNVQRYLDWLLASSGVRDYAALRTAHFARHGGLGVLRHFDGSPQRMVRAAAASRLSESEGVEVSVPTYNARHHWASVVEQRRFLDAVGAQLGVASSADGWERWYTIRRVQVEQAGGHTLLKNYYAGSMYAMLAAVYPEHAWLPWRFRRLPRRTWADERVLGLARRHAEETLGLRTVDDWLRLSSAALARLGLTHLVKMAGGIDGLLARTGHDRKEQRPIYEEEGKQVEVNNGTQMS